MSRGSLWCLCLLLVAIGRGESAEMRRDSLAADLDYWYVDIYKPFFAERRVASGTVMVAQRPRSRSVEFPLIKPPGTLRVFVIGGSVAMQYDTEPDESRGWTLQKVLERVLPGRRIEVVHCGMGAYDSYRESLVFREVLEYQPDAIVLMSGNNDDGAAAGAPSRRLLWALRAQRVLSSIGIHLQSGRGDVPDAPQRDYMRSFESNLRAMARAAKARGVKLVLCTLPRQLGLPARGTLPLQMPTFFNAWSLVERGQTRAAEAAFRRHLTYYPSDDIGHLWLGRLLERGGDAAGARREYWEALELRSHVPRANRLIRVLCAQEGAVLADLERAFLRASPGPRNENLLADEMHWNRFVDPLVSIEIARALSGSQPSGPGARWLAREGAGLCRSTATPREFEQMFTREIGQAFWSTLSTPGRMSETSIALFESLHRDYPGRLAAAIRQPEVFLGNMGGRIADTAWLLGGHSDWHDCWASGLGHLAEAYRRLGLRRVALRCFEESLRLDPGQDVVRVHMAMTLAALGQTARARALLDGLKQPTELFPELCLSLRRCDDAEPAPEARNSAASSPEPSMLPVLREDRLKRAFDEFDRRQWSGGFRELSDAMGGFSPEGFHALDRYCADLSRDCAPWRRAQDAVEALNSKGIRLLAAGDKVGAGDAFDEALRYWPTQISALLNRAAVDGAQGRFDAAVSLYGRALRGDLSAPGLLSEILSSRATALERLGRTREAVDNLEWAVRAAPQGWPRREETRRRLFALRQSRP